MKDKGSIEELFKSKFEHFEPKVDAGLWTNIAGGIKPIASVGKTGVSWIAKTLIIGTATAGIALGTWIYTKEDGFYAQNSQENATINGDNSILENDLSISNIIQIETKNDPIITAHQSDIEEELNKNRDSFSSAVKKMDLNTVAIAKAGPDKQVKVTPIHVEHKNGVVVKNNPTTVVGEPSIRPLETSKEDLSNTQDQKIVFDGFNVQVNQQDYLTVNCTVDAKDADSVVWNFDDGSKETSNIAVHTYHYEGTYDVVMQIYKQGNAIQKNQLIAIAASSSIAEIPNVITPNNDGANDEFLIHSENLKSFYIVIQTQKGEKLFESNDPNFKWAGYALNGEKVNEGIYFYQINATGEEGKKYRIPGQLYIK
ncbi:hypothetical protein DNU06_11955 [Putridiphycobacter roseus]|uniref:PKD domain-containing protein n=1 Tax=Putridiphycobacter roseus TaxID=2219161 RepID=A0A2W1N0S2_9FLAO|nr:gliding motility-associated C-terminal domain-containing protein [Putridiphycobacter roseus]PZE16561.1 hypothetical protein DNU06_11955 [Putridiphycobacter roseus]